MNVTHENLETEHLPKLFQGPSICIHRFNPGCGVILILHMGKLKVTTKKTA